jgi:hypothetical protein
MWDAGHVRRAKAHRRRVRPPRGRKGAGSLKFVAVHPLGRASDNASRCAGTSGSMWSCMQLSSHPSVTAGDEISRSKYAGYGRGTACLIVRPRGAVNGAQLLTCAHVLGTPSIDDAGGTADQVFAPELSTCLGSECNNPVGSVVATSLQPRADSAIQAMLVVGPEAFAVDAALVNLDAKANASNVVPKIGVIKSVRDLIGEWGLASQSQTDLAVPVVKQVKVAKFGSSTGYSEGTIRRLARQHAIEQAAGQTLERDVLLFEIQANPGQKPFTAEYELDMPRFLQTEGLAQASAIAAQFNTSPALNATIGGSATSPTLKIVGNTFSQPGDSGAPIVDENGRIVGMLASGTFGSVYVKGRQEPARIATGESQAIFIKAALDKLQVDFLPAGQNTAGATVVVPGMAVSRGWRAALHRPTLDQIATAIEDTPQGSRLVALARRHSDEVRHLIHHRRRVTVTWHRYKGPGFVASLMRGDQSAGALMPSEIDGVPLTEALRAMTRVLRAEGSAALQAELLGCEGELLVLAAHATTLTELDLALRSLARAAT